MVIYCALSSNNTLIVVSEATPKDSPEMYKQRNFIRDNRLYFPVMTYI